MYPGSDGAAGIFEVHLTVGGSEVPFRADDVDNEVGRHVSTELCLQMSQGQLDGLEESRSRKLGARRSAPSSQILTSLKLSSLVMSYTKIAARAPR